jgi:transcriptional regulator with XRE-family HTH domain
MFNAKKFLIKKVGPVTIGTLLRVHRTRHGLTQVRLANSLGLSIKLLSSIENSKKNISLEKTLKIAHKLRANREFYACIWFEDEARRNGISLERIMKALIS